MDFVNLTPHNISLLNDDMKIVFFIPFSGVVARCRYEIESESIYGGIKIVKSKILKVENLPPEPKKHPSKNLRTYYIVSKQVARFCHDIGRIGDILTPFDVIKDKNGKVVGCKSFSRPYSHKQYYKIEI